MSKIAKPLLLSLLCGISIGLSSQNTEIELWEHVPNSIDHKDYQPSFRKDRNGEINGLRKVTNPTLKIFLADNRANDNTAVIICPGGGYSLLSHIKEGDKVAQWLNSIGMSAFVLKYRLPSDEIMTNKTIGPLQDVQEAIRTVRRNAKKWNLDTNKIGVMGFSAGGHLASTASTHYTDVVYDSDTTSARPDFSILIYPVISMKDGITHNGSKVNLLGENASKTTVEYYSNETQIDENTPPTFLVHSTDDKAVPVENSIHYYLGLKKHNILSEMHIYQDGGHGYGLGVKGTTTNWPRACQSWLSELLKMRTD